MNYKGAYDGKTSYSVGDVVVFDDDNIAYKMFAEAPAGTKPHDTHAWVRLGQPFQEIVMMFHSAFSAVPKNISEDAILMKDDSDNEYIVTVDASGDTPELAVTLVEEED